MPQSTEDICIFLALNTKNIKTFFSRQPCIDQRSVPFLCVRWFNDRDYLTVIFTTEHKFINKKQWWKFKFNYDLIPSAPSVNNPDARRSPIPRPQFILAKNQLQDLPVLGPALRRVPQPKKEASPMRRQGNTITTDINYQGHSNKTVNFAAITEDDIEDDREYFDLSTLLTSDTQLHVRSSQSHLTYGKVLWSLRARKEVWQRFRR